MPFCAKCGKEVGEGLALCPSCGASLEGEKKKPAAKKVDFDSKTLLFISIAAIGALGLICLLAKDAIGLVLSAGACAALFFLGVKKLEQNDTNTAQLTALIVGIVVVVIGLVTLLVGGGKGAFIGLLDIAAVVPCFMAWNMLRK